MWTAPADQRRDRREVVAANSVPAQRPTTVASSAGLRQPTLPRASTNASGRG